MCFCTIKDWGRVNGELNHRSEIIPILIGKCIVFNIVVPKCWVRGWRWRLKIQVFLFIDLSENWLQLLHHLSVSADQIWLAIVRIYGACIRIHSVAFCVFQIWSVLFERWDAFEYPAQCPHLLQNTFIKHFRVFSSSPTIILYLYQYQHEE